MVSKTIDVGSIPTAPVVMTREPPLTVFLCAAPHRRNTLRNTPHRSPAPEREFMKKIALSLILTLFFSLLLIGCGEEKPVFLSTTDYDLDAETSQTIRGVKIGDHSDAFLAAYRDYDILTSISGGDYLPLPAEDIPFDASITTILPSFFVDGAALEIDRFCEENNIEKDGLLSFLTNEEYLSAHSVVYRYLVFSWEDGAITQIRSEAMDYNRDGSYYQPSDDSTDNADHP